jgi:hypothetical protein
VRLGGRGRVDGFHVVVARRVHLHRDQAVAAGHAGGQFVSVLEQAPVHARGRRARRGLERVVDEVARLGRRRPGEAFDDERDLVSRPQRDAFLRVFQGDAAGLEVVRHLSRPLALQWNSRA